MTDQYAELDAALDRVVAAAQAHLAAVKAAPGRVDDDDVWQAYVDLIEVPCETNPLGVKGAGEAGAVGSPPAVINALVDALAEDGVRHLDMPATPEAVWRAIAAAGGGGVKRAA